jgi:DnaJ-class molecular chaperone
MDYFIVIVIGIIFGRFLLTKELGLKLRNKIRNKTINKTIQGSRYEICPMCKGDGDMADIEEQRYVKCPQCNGSGRILIVK